MYYLKALLSISKNLRVRLNLIYMSLFGICIVFISLFITGQYLQMAQKDFDRDLYNYALDLSEYVKNQKYFYELKIPEIELRKEHPFILNQTLITMRSLDGKIVYSNLSTKKGLPFNRALSTNKNYQFRFFQYENFRCINIKIKHPIFNDLILQVAANDSSLTELKSRLKILLMIVLPITFIFTAIAGFWVAGIALDPIPRLISEVHHLIKSGTFIPLHVTKTNDEIEELTLTFNQFVTHMEQTLRAQENFLAQASHQLYTPLAIINGEIDVLMTKPRSHEEVLAFHISLKEEIKRLQLLVNKMMLLARVEAGKEHLVFNPHRIDELILGVIERLKNEKEKKMAQFKINFNQSIYPDEFNIPCDVQLLTCLFENLLENALKFSPQGGVISINLGRGTDSLKIEILDQGPGFDLEKIRSGIKQNWIGPNKLSSNSHGLGLVISHKIATLHGFSMNLQNSPAQGASVQIIIPLTFLHG